VNVLKCGLSDSVVRSRTVQPQLDGSGRGLFEVPQSVTDNRRLGRDVNQAHPQ
jgi:hypothetical protein